MFDYNTKVRKKSTKKNPWLLLAVTSLGACMVGIDGGIVNVALPTITKQFGISLAVSQWGITSYLLGLCVLLPLCGRLGDLYTKRLIYLGGFIIFTISSLLCAVSLTFPQLVIFRLIQGIGGAMIIANNQALILMNFPKAKIGQALGLNSVAVSAGLILGPSIGGFLIGAFGWQSIFIINLPVGIIGVCTGYKLLPRNEKKKKESLDLLGTVLFMIGLSILLLAISNGLEWQWSWQKITGISLTGLAILTGFVFWEYKAKNPMVDLTIFKNKDFCLGNIGAFLVFMCIATNNLLLPFSLQNLFNLTPSLIGLFLFITPLVMIVVSPISGYLSDIIDQTILISLGAGVITIGMLIEAFIEAGTSLWAIAFAQALLGIGFGMFSSPNNSNTLGTINPERLGIASSINGLVRNISKIFGTALTAITISEVEHYFVASQHHISNTRAFIIGFRISFIMAAILAIIATILGATRLLVLNKGKKCTCKNCN